jgi:hypothetical protein
MREIGCVYAPLDPVHNDEMPRQGINEALFLRVPISAVAWIAFENSKLCDDVRALKPGGIIGTYEESWFDAPKLPALIALLERPCTLVPEACAFLAQLATFARLAYARGVSITLVIDG